MALHDARTGPTAHPIANGNITPDSIERNEMRDPRRKTIVGREGLNRFIRAGRK
jgi:hypothetical protein